MPADLQYVSYNDGSQTRVGIVLEDKGDTKYDLFVLNEDGGYVANDVPRREPEDYGDEGGGVTWYEPRD